MNKRSLIELAAIGLLAVIVLAAAIHFWPASTLEDLACSRPTSTGGPREVAWVESPVNSRWVRCFKGEYFSEIR